MVISSDEVFKGWLEIMEKQNKKSTATVFRCLVVLDEQEVKQIQLEIKSGQIFISKGAKDVDFIDILERIKHLKQDKIIQDAGQTMSRLGRIDNHLQHQ